MKKGFQKLMFRFCVHIEVLALALWLLVYWVCHLCDGILDVVGYLCFSGRGQVLFRGQCCNADQEEER
jgi:hypothetical protein